VPVRCVSVIIADRHPVVLCGLNSVLRAERDFKVVASCRDGRTCLQAVRDLAPNLAVLDFFLPGLTGLEILAATRAEHLCTRIVFLAACTDESEVLAAIARGAYGVLPKDVAPNFLVRSLRQAASGMRLPVTTWEGQPRNGHEYDARIADENLPIALTQRERQIIQLVSHGLSNKEVGRQLTVSDGTIKVHLHHIYRKLAIHNRTALAALAASHHDDTPLAIEQVAGLGT
jgi:two-component system, NarL family, nitrate/nitrite response regulator NarL